MSDHIVWPQVQVQANGCHWLPTVPDLAGYARIYVSRKRYYGHRAAYESVYGSIPVGLTVDHTCHNSDPECPGGKTCTHRRCVNPAHLEAVSVAVNNRRGKSPFADHGRKTECKHGHPFTAENTLKVKNGRRCATCHRTAERLRHQARRASA